jgi:hypothetical protein
MLRPTASDTIKSMASTPHSTLKLSPLSKQSMAQLLAKAKRMGVPPEDYAKRLVEDGLAFQREAENASFAEIMEPVRKAAGTVGEVEIVKLVEKARTDYHRNASGKKKS